MGADGSIRWADLDARTASWVTEHLYCERYHLSAAQYLDEPVTAVRWRSAVAGVIDERTRPED